MTRSTPVSENRYRSRGPQRRRCWYRMLPQRLRSVLGILRRLLCRSSRWRCWRSFKWARTRGALGKRDSASCEGLNMTRVLQIPLSKEKLRALSKEERVALFLFGNVANQIVMMETLLTFAHNDASPNGALEQQAAGLQGQMILRLMIGLLQRRISSNSDALQLQSPRKNIPRPAGCRRGKGSSQSKSTILSIDHPAN
jgi:hypothetical protein